MPFEFVPGPIPGLVVVHPRVFGDDRGWFAETYKASEFVKNGVPHGFAQDNHSLSSLNVLRGLHFQTGEHAQGKLVRCTRGRVWDVAVDLRRGSETFRNWFGIELSEENRTLFYLPPGFAHGFVVLSGTAEFQYKCTVEYNAGADGGVRFDDPAIGIEWPIDTAHVLVSSKDLRLPLLADLGEDFGL